MYHYINKWNIKSPLNKFSNMLENTNVFTIFYIYLSEAFFTLTCLGNLSRCLEGERGGPMEKM